MTTTKTSKPQQKGLQDDDSKPAMLAKLIFPAIIRMIKAKRSKQSPAVGKRAKFLLDSGNARRICVEKG